MAKRFLRAGGWIDLLIGVIGVAAIFFMLVWLTGCAGATTSDGRVVVGWDVARLTETPEQILAAGAGFLPPPFNALASALIGGGAVGYVSRRARIMADKAFDEGVARSSNTPAVPAVAPPTVVSPT